MRVLVTGGAGFVGSHLLSALVAAGHAVTAVDNLASGSIANLAQRVHFIKADVRSPLEQMLLEVRPEVVIHLAAQTSVPDSIKEPGHDLAVNIGGTVNTMSAAAAAGARKFVYISSAAVYGVPQTLPLTEASAPSPLSPYGLSKRTAEEYVRMLGAQHGLAYTILRPANIFGPRQTTDGEGAVIPAFLNRFLMGQAPVIHGDGSQIRDFMYVTDMARAIIQALHHSDGLTLNVSTGVGITVLEVWQRLAAVLGWTDAPRFGPLRAGDIPRSIMANDAAREHLQWTPTTPFIMGLQETVTWARQAEVAATLSR